MAPPHPVYFQEQAPPQTPLPKPTPPSPKHPRPRLRLKAQDLTHPSVSTFFRSVDASNILSESINTVLSILYPSEPSWPATRSVTLVLEDMPGVAFTTGIQLDNMHKEIHLSLAYVSNISSERLSHEITGVMVHEMVHCWQWNAQGTAPGGLIEGIADWVRLKAGFAPPHWKRSAKGKWDGGYERTGYFLEYLEQTYGRGSIVKLNERLKEDKYDEEKFWEGLFNKKVEKLWDHYRKHLKKHGEDPDDESESESESVVESPH